MAFFWRVAHTIQYLRVGETVFDHTIRKRWLEFQGNDNLNQILQLFSVRGFNERDTVSLLGAHNIGKISCQFIRSRLYNFKGTGQPYSTMTGDFLNEMRLNCQESNNNSVDVAPAPIRSRKMTELTAGMS